MNWFHKEPEETDLATDDPGVELAANRTGIAFERTRMAADRTLMAMVRTSLSLIGFGFTIHTAFQKLAESSAVPMKHDSARNFGLALIVIGVAMLAMGIASHIKFQKDLDGRHVALFEKKLLRHSASYLSTPTFGVAAALLLVGLAAFCMIAFSILSGE